MAASPNAVGGPRAPGDPSVIGAAFGAGLPGDLVPATVAALLIGLRHAGDPDHVTSIATPAVPGRRVQAATELGLAFGVGHALTLALLGLPAILAGAFLPPAARAAAEIGTAMLLVALAARLWVRWRRGRLHAHPHVHGSLVHSHPHYEVEGPGGAGGGGTRHDHVHGRSPHAAFAAGLERGVGVSAAACLLVLASFERRDAAALALALLVLGAALTMIAASAGIGLALERGPLARRLRPGPVAPLS